MHPTLCINKVLRILLMLLLLAVAGDADARKRKPARTRQKPKTEQSARTMESVRREQSTTQRKISETARQLDTNDRELNRQMSRLNALNADIETQRGRVALIRSRVDSLGSAIRTTSDSISILESQLETLRIAYADAMRKIQPSGGDLNEFTFIFSAKTFQEAWSRIRYLRRFARWRESKARDINDAVERISGQRRHLTSMRHSQDIARRQAESESRTLESQQAESARMVADLRKQDSRLKAQLKEYQRRSAALDRELDRLIVAEQQRIEREERERARREAKGASASRDNNKASGGKTSGAKSSGAKSAPAPDRIPAPDRKLTGSFAANKGRLLFPVTGRYRIIRRFGTQPHPTLRHVTVDNSGIDIQTAPGSAVRSVFEGTVSAIFRQEGFGNIVMIRHGSYLTVYAGLASVSVSKGEKVATGRTIGTLADENLHFEVRKERQKLNPSAWVR